MSDDEYKRAKEAFVSGLAGTTAREVFAVFALMPVSISPVSITAASANRY